MQYVYVLLTYQGFILGVYTTLEAAQRHEAAAIKVGHKPRISHEPLIVS